MTTKLPVNPKALLARMLLVAFVVGGLIYFTSACPLAVNVSVRLPYKITSSDGSESVRRRDVREIEIVFDNDENVSVANSRLYVDRGVGPEPTAATRLSLAPGSYTVRLEFKGSEGQSVNALKEVLIEEEGDLLLDLR